MPRFSIVVPVYNGLPYLRECLDSLVSQTLNDFEVICVDDYSTDESLDVLKDYASRDDRIIVLEHPENRGSARARRAGVLSSTGDFVLFSDQDDSYNPKSLEEIDAALRRRPVDILQYGVKVINDGGVPQWDVDESQKWMTPYKGKLFGRAIVDGCFAQGLFSYSIWNKAYEGEMARKAFGCMVDTPIPLGEDNYASFVLAYFADSYDSISDKLYCYHYGRGYTGQNALTVEKYVRTCGLAVAAKLIADFLIEQGFYPEFEKTCKAARAHMLNYCLSIWELQIAECDRTAAFEKLLEQWPYIEVLDAVVGRMPWALSYLATARFGARESFVSACEKERRIFDAWSELDRLTAEYAGLKESIEQKRNSCESSKAFRRGNAVVRRLKRLSARLPL